MLESKIEKDVSKYAESLGWLAYKWSSPSQRGVMDRIFIYNNVIIFVEFKQVGKLPTKLQNYHIRRVRDRGFKVYIIDNVEDGVALINRITNEENDRHNG